MTKFLQTSIYDKQQQQKKREVKQKSQVFLLILGPTLFRRQHLFKSVSFVKDTVHTPYSSAFPDVISFVSIIVFYLGKVEVG